MKQKECSIVKNAICKLNTPYAGTYLYGNSRYDKLISEIYDLRDDNKLGIRRSNKGGWHSKDRLDPVIDELKNFFNQVQGWANNYCAQITGITDLVLGNWWVNINPKYTYNRRHDHQKSILSGVYYVDCEGENIGKLVVERDDNMEFFGGRY